MSQFKNQEAQKEPKVDDLGIPKSVQWKALVVMIHKEQNLPNGLFANVS